MQNLLSGEWGEDIEGKEDLFLAAPEGKSPRPAAEIPAQHAGLSLGLQSQQPWYIYSWCLFLKLKTSVTQDGDISSRALLLAAVPE